MKRCEPLRASYRAASARIVARGQFIYGLNLADIREFVEGDRGSGASRIAPPVFFSLVHYK
jgi:hypothetical protein